MHSADPVELNLALKSPVGEWSCNNTYIHTQIVWKQIVDYMERDSAQGAIQPGLKIQARYSQTRLGFSAGPNGVEIWKSLMQSKRNFSPCRKRNASMRIDCVFAPQLTAFCARAEIEHVITTIFQPGGRSEISARAETHYVIRPWEITMWDWKITTLDWRITVWEIEVTIREWKTVMRDHNYQSRTKNCQTRFIVTVENEKSLCEKKKITIREYRLVFFLSREA